MHDRELSVPELSRRWLELLKKIEDYKENISDVRAEIDQVRDFIFKKMEAEGITNLRLTEGLIYLQTSAYANFPMRKKDDIIRWFKENAPDYPVTVMELRKTLIKDYFTEALEHDLPLPPADLIDMSPIREVRFKRSTGGKKDESDEE